MTCLLSLRSEKIATVFCVFSVLTLLFAGCQDDQSEEPSSDKQGQKTRSANKDTAQSARLSILDLNRAARKGQMARVRRAIEDGGLDANASGPNGNTPLMLASYNGHRAVAEFLLGRGARIDARNGQGRTALMFAATGPFPETVSFLLKRGADPNATDQTEGWSPLMFAAAEGNKEVARVLLKQGADPTLTDQDGETARTFAENGNHTAVVSLLGEEE